MFRFKRSQILIKGERIFVKTIGNPRNTGKNTLEGGLERSRAKQNFLTRSFNEFIARRNDNSLDLTDVEVVIDEERRKREIAKTATMQSRYTGHIAT